MPICPKDLKPCIDDLCFGGSCLLLPGVCPLTRCNGCGQFVSLDGSDLEDCECEPEQREDRWEDDGP